MAETFFKKSFKGYDPEQVDAFIIALSDKYTQNEKELNEKLNNTESENERLKNEINALTGIQEQMSKEFEETLEAKQKEYDRLCAEVGEKMVLADKRAAEIIKNAEREAALILTTARTNAENEARAIRINAENEADRLVEETRRKCDSVTAAAEEFRIRQNEMNRSISETEKQFGDALNKLREGITRQE